MIIEFTSNGFEVRSQLPDNLDVEGTGPYSFAGIRAEGIKIIKVIQTLPYEGMRFNHSIRAGRNGIANVIYVSARFDHDHIDDIYKQLRAVLRAAFPAEKIK